jgi:hypothetical protein
MLLRSFNEKQVLRSNFGDRSKAVESMKLSIATYWPNRKNAIARLRIRSALKVIRQIENNIMDIKEYIRLVHNGEISIFAKINSVTEEKVNSWIESGYIVYEDTIYKPEQCLESH